MTDLSQVAYEDLCKEIEKRESMNRKNIRLEQALLLIKELNNFVLELKSKENPDEVPRFKFNRVPLDAGL